MTQTKTRQVKTKTGPGQDQDQDKTRQVKAKIKCKEESFPSLIQTGESSSLHLILGCQLWFLKPNPLS